MTWWIYCLNKEQPTKAKTSLKAMATSPDAMHDLNKETKKQTQGGRGCQRFPKM